MKDQLQCREKESENARFTQEINNLKDQLQKSEDSRELETQQHRTDMIKLRSEIEGLIPEVSRLKNFLERNGHNMLKEARNGACLSATGQSNESNIEEGNLVASRASNNNQDDEAVENGNIIHNDSGCDDSTRSDSPTNSEFSSQSSGSCRDPSFDPSRPSLSFDAFRPSTSRSRGPPFKKKKHSHEPKWKSHVRVEMLHPIPPHKNSDDIPEMVSLSAYEAFTKRYYKKIKIANGPRTVACKGHPELCSQDCNWSMDGVTGGGPQAHRENHFNNLVGAEYVCNICEFVAPNSCPFLRMCQHFQKDHPKDDLSYFGV